MKRGKILFFVGFFVIIFAMGLFMSLLMVKPVRCASLIERMGEAGGGCKVQGCINLIPDAKETRRILKEIDTGAHAAWEGGHKASQDFAKLYLKAGVAVATGIAYVPGKIREEIMKKRPKSYRKSKTRISRVRAYVPSKIAFKGSYKNAAKISSVGRQALPKFRMFKKSKRAKKSRGKFRIDVSGLRGANF